MKELLKLFVVDVDGTMTDGGIYYDEHGNEMKKFNTKDAAGFFAAHALGIKIMILTGRECKATARRLEELKADLIYQNIRDKKGFLEKYMWENHLQREDVGYIGDDLNDMLAMKLAGYIGCPFDSCNEIKLIADFVSEIKGGDGVVRDVIEHYLKENNEWESAVRDGYGIGI